MGERLWSGLRRCTGIAAVAFVVLSGASWVRAQTAQPSETTQEEDDRADGLTYDSQGRRDPFRPLTGDRGSDDERSVHEGTLRGLLWQEVRLTTIMATPTGNLAMFEGGPKREGYVAREGDRFWNAFVYRIDSDNATVVVREELDDPRLLKPYRDWPINLYGTTPQQTQQQARGRR